MVELSKSTLDVKSALLKASDLAATLRAVEGFMLDQHAPTEESLEKWKSLDAVDDALKLLSEVEDLTEEQQNLVTALQDAKKSILEQAPNLDTSCEMLADFLERQWKGKEGSQAFSFVFDDQSSVDSVQELYPAMYAGWG